MQFRGDHDASEEKIPQVHAELEKVGGLEEPKDRADDHEDSRDAGDNFLRTEDGAL